MTQRLNGRLAIVTGGSSGIGRAIVQKFAAHGAKVVVADITTNAIEGGPPICDVVAEKGGTAVFIKTDISNAAEVDALVAKTVERFGRLDILVNNAVLRAGKPLLETEEGDWDQVMDVSLKGAYLCARATVRQMLKQELVGDVRGRLVHISSQHGHISAPEDFAYGVSKAGIAYMTKQIAADYAKDFIISNGVAPGKILTGKGGRAVEPRWLDYSNSRTPWPRLGTPEDVANAALFLASDEATYITGHNLFVDGGWMAA
ncbi:SDR family oxidoreductase [Phyllobacterium sp. 0TCS1.6C]|uniref:SDR family NAD(P)-dependent oxidoreductase n=1 Tax=unclassified Phyllobacterium TaxID=2638441 RepID=UPI002263CDFD|nr:MULTISPECIES: SDR family oxidoreductase [unclassified Phyllobacterium]MCX8279215.1 SDR family oxidoreductase [Phyllobacterium sp. 0TCS1.6C]MCX8293999.1 SDR family oxidoreductase [Phyllobacterium sp. 0TCS1.6A]